MVAVAKPEGAKSKQEKKQILTHVKKGKKVSIEGCVWRQRMGVGAQCRCVRQQTEPGSVCKETRTKGLCQGTRACIKSLGRVDSRGLRWPEPQKKMETDWEHEPKTAERTC